MEKVLNVLREMGFELTEADELGYVFKYEDLNFVLINSNNDDDFLCLCLPGVVEKNEMDGDDYYTLTEKVNSTLKYVKAYTLFDDMWLFYERELIGEENLSEIISNMIFRLEAGFLFIRKSQSEAEEENEDN